MDKRKFKKVNRKIEEMINLFTIFKRCWNVSYYDEDIEYLCNLKLEIQQKYKERVNLELEDQKKLMGVLKHNKRLNTSDSE